MADSQQPSQAEVVWGVVFAVLGILGLFFAMQRVGTVAWPWLQEHVVTDQKPEQQPEAPPIYTPRATYLPPLPPPLDLLDCADFGGPFVIDPWNDPYGLDADNDGIACE